MVLHEVLKGRLKETSNQRVEGGFDWFVEGFCRRWQCV